MKYIFVNLKRFDIPVRLGGVNRLCETDWGGEIVRRTQDGVRAYANCKFVHFFPEAHVISALGAKSDDSPIHVGCQGVFYDDVSAGGNFGAFTTSRTARSMKALGCDYTIIGHCEERRDKLRIAAACGAQDFGAIDGLLNQEAARALEAEMSVLFCVGETADQQPQKYETLKRQLSAGLEGLDPRQIVIAYEPVWAIGPGKTPPGRDYIQDIAAFIKKETGGLPVVYGGGLKEDNASMLASIPEIDGGLIALTRFSGDIGFYPQEYLKIVETYLEGRHED